MIEITPAIISKTRVWLGPTGVSFFKGLLLTYGTVSPVYMEGKIPHPVHFREGMQVRNFLRSTGLCKDWTAHDLDNNWAEVIKEAIK